MEALLVLVAVVTAASSLLFPTLRIEEWIAYKLAHNKSYVNNKQEEYHKVIFAENKQKIAAHNEMYDCGLVSFRLRENKYGDVNHEEFVRIMNGYNRTGEEDLARRIFTDFRPATFIQPGHVTVPAAVDWRDNGAVTAIKDQGKCSSCWAFSTTGALEGQQYRKSGYLISLSEQNLVDCSSGYGNMGCNGGLMDYANQYIADNCGIDTEMTYPYEGKDGKCRYNRLNSGAASVGVVSIPQGDEQALKAAVAIIGPISVAIDASLETFQLYSDGVYYDENCSSENLDHAVLVVGYGTDLVGGDYWLIKNSWGRSWGEAGYVRLARNRGNHCGVAAQASYPLVP